MSDEVFDLLLSSGAGVNKMYHLAEDYHFGVAVSVEPWVIELDSYAVSLGGVYQRALDYALREFSSRKNGITLNLAVQPELMDEALHGIIEFGRTPMSGYFCRKYPDKSGYRLEAGCGKYSVLYRDADRCEDNLVGYLMIATDFLTKEPNECKTRGQYGVKFWWVNAGSLVHYFLFTTGVVANEKAAEYYNSCYLAFSRHLNKKIVRSCAYEGGSSRIFGCREHKGCSDA